MPIFEIFLYLWSKKARFIQHDYRKYRTHEPTSTDEFLRLANKIYSQIVIIIIIIIIIIIAFSYPPTKNKL